MTRLTRKEDFYTGTSAAAKGGITTVFEMPTSDLAVTTRERFLRRRTILEPKAVIDFAMYGAAGTDPDELPGLADAGVIAFKTFLCPPMPGREQNWAGAYALTSSEMLTIFQAVAATGAWAASTRRTAVSSTRSRTAPRRRGSARSRLMWPRIPR